MPPRFKTQRAAKTIKKENMNHNGTIPTDQHTNRISCAALQLIFLELSCVAFASVFASGPLCLRGAPPNPHHATLHRARSQLHRVLALQNGVHSHRSVSASPGHNLKHENYEPPKFLQHVFEKGGGSILHWFRKLGSTLLWTMGCNLSGWHNDEQCFQQELRTPGF